jgi:hypothetical protein
MPADIFRFWSGIRLRRGAHPADFDVLSRVRHNFDLNCLPGCFSGPLRTAPVVLLYLSPGLSEQDYTDAETRAGRKRWRRRLSGRAPLPAPEDHDSAWRWWKRRTSSFGHWQDLQTKVAILNIGAYHSKKFKDRPLLAALPSSRVSLDWAQRVLFPSATAGDRVVVCLRAARFWGLREGERYGRALFAPPVTMGGYMKKRGKMRSLIIREVRHAVSSEA